MWKDLSIQEKADLMKAAIKGGVTDLNTVKKFADGGYLDNLTTKPFSYKPIPVVRYDKGGPLDGEGSEEHQQLQKKSLDSLYLTPSQAIAFNRDTPNNAFMYKTGEDEFLYPEGLVPAIVSANLSPKQYKEAINKGEGEKMAETVREGMNAAAPYVGGTLLGAYGLAAGLGALPYALPYIGTYGSKALNGVGQMLNMATPSYWVNHLGAKCALPAIKTARLGFLADSIASFGAIRATAIESTNKLRSLVHDTDIHNAKDVAKATGEAAWPLVKLFGPAAFPYAIRKARSLVNFRKYGNKRYDQVGMDKNLIDYFSENPYGDKKVIAELAERPIIIKDVEGILDPRAEAAFIPFTEVVRVNPEAPSFKLSDRYARSLLAHEGTHAVSNSYNIGSVQSLSTPHGSYFIADHTHPLYRETSILDRNGLGNWHASPEEFSAEMSLLRELTGQHKPFKDLSKFYQNRFSSYLSWKFGLTKSEAANLATALSEYRYDKGGHLYDGDKEKTQQLSFWDKLKNGFAQATMKAAMADAPAIMTASGWEIDPQTQKISQGDPTAEGPSRLADNLGTISMLANMESAPLMLGPKTALNYLTTGLNYLTPGYWFTRAGLPTIGLGSDLLAGTFGTYTGVKDIIENVKDKKYGKAILNGLLTGVGAASDARLIKMLDPKVRASRWLPKEVRGFKDRIKQTPSDKAEDYINKGIFQDLMYYPTSEIGDTPVYFDEKAHKFIPVEHPERTKIVVDELSDSGLKTVDEFGHEVQLGTYAPTRRSQYSIEYTPESERKYTHYRGSERFDGKYLYPAESKQGATPYLWFNADYPLGSYTTEHFAIGATPYDATGVGSFSDDNFYRLFKGPVDVSDAAHTRYNPVYGGLETKFRYMDPAELATKIDGKTSYTLFERPTSLSEGELAGLPKGERNNRRTSKELPFTLVNRGDSYIPIEDGKFVFDSPEKAGKLSTIHFTQNIPVTSHNGGSWNSKSTTMLVPYGEVRRSVAPINIEPMDTFFPNYGGVKFSTNGSKVLTGDKAVYDYYKSKGIDVEFSKETEELLEKYKKIYSKWEAYNTEHNWFPDAESLKLESEFNDIGEQIQKIHYDFTRKHSFKPTFEDYLKLEKIEELPSGVKPVSDKSYPSSLERELGFSFFSAPSTHSSLIDINPSGSFYKGLPKKQKEYTDWLLKNIADYRGEKLFYNGGHLYDGNTEKTQQLNSKWANPVFDLQNYGYYNGLPTSTPVTLEPTREQILELMWNSENPMNVGLNPNGTYSKYADPSKRVDANGNSLYDVGPGLLVGSTIPDKDFYTKQELEDAAFEVNKKALQNIAKSFNGVYGENAFDKVDPQLKLIMLDTRYRTGNLAQTKFPKLYEAVHNGDIIKALLESRTIYKKGDDEMSKDNDRVRRLAESLYPGRFIITEEDGVLKIVDTQNKDKK